MYEIEKIKQFATYSTIDAMHECGDSFLQRTIEMLMLCGDHARGESKSTYAEVLDELKRTRRKLMGICNSNLMDDNLLDNEKRAQ